MRILLIEDDRLIGDGIKAGLGKLDLVTREEFDVQRAVLLRTREKLETLEKAVAELEARGAAAPRE